VRRGGAAVNDQRNGGVSWCDLASSPPRYRDASGKTVFGCVKTSPGGCACHAQAIALRVRRGGPLTKATMAGLTASLDEKELRALLTSRKISGTKVFLNDVTDTFGEWVSDDLIADLFAVMAARPDVTFQVLTKRADRMRKWFDWAADAQL